MPASGGKRDPPAKAMPASGGSSSRSFASGAVQSKSSGSKGAEAEKGKGKGKWKTLASGRSIHPDARYSHPSRL